MCVSSFFTHISYTVIQFSLFVIVGSKLLIIIRKYLLLGNIILGIESREHQRLLRLYEEVSTDDEAEPYSESDESFKPESDENILDSSDVDNTNDNLESDSSYQCTDEHLQEPNVSHEPNNTVQEPDVGTVKLLTLIFSLKNIYKSKEQLRVQFIHHMKYLPNCGMMKL